jgi:hypothetical protein
MSTNKPLLNKLDNEEQQDNCYFPSKLARN